MLQHHAVLFAHVAGDLVLLDAPLSLVAESERILLTGRYASLETADADAVRDDVTARLVLVRQPLRGCPAYERAAVRGNLVLEISARTLECSIGARVSRAAASGAVGWLHKADYAAGALVVPGAHGYRLARGETTLLASAPPAVEITQPSAGLAWLHMAAEAGAQPRVSLRLRRPDRWARLRTSGWVRLFQALIGLSSIAVIELALSRLHAITSTQHVQEVERVSNTRRSILSVATSGADSRAWHVGPALLVIAAISSVTRFVYVVVDPLVLFGTFPPLASQLLLITPAALALGGQVLYLTYTWELLVHRVGIATLMLCEAEHKAVVLVGHSLSLGTELVLFALRDRVHDVALILAFYVVGPALLATVCALLIRTARRWQAGATLSSVEGKLLPLVAGNCAVAAAGLALYFVRATPDGMMASAFVALVGLDFLAYSQCEQIEPLGVRPIRGPLRVLVELARGALHAARARLRTRARAGDVVRSSPSTSTARAAPPEPGKAQPAQNATQGRDHLARVTPIAQLARDEITRGDGDDTLSRCKRASVIAPLPDTGELTTSHLALGVSLACLRDFARGADESAATSTTAEMVARVRAMTSVLRLSFAELNIANAASDGFPAVGRASVFVSHAQSRGFAKLLDALDALVTNQKLRSEETYFWVDMMCIRQHEVAADVMRIGEVICAIGKVAMVLDPWDKPVCLERVWCLYEIAQTVVDRDDSRQPRARAYGAQRPSSFRTRELDDSSFRRGRNRSEPPVATIGRAKLDSGDCCSAAGGHAPREDSSEFSLTGGRLRPVKHARADSCSSLRKGGRHRSESLRSFVLPATSGADYCGRVKAEVVATGGRSKTESLNSFALPLLSGSASTEGGSAASPYMEQALARPMPDDGDERPRVQLFLTMSAAERLKLMHVARKSRSQIERALTRFDCRTAGASVDADRHMILAYIAHMYAVDDSNSTRLAEAAGAAATLRNRTPSTGGEGLSAETETSTQQLNESEISWRDASEANAQLAYENFNERVKLAIHEAVASLSHGLS